MDGKQDQSALVLFSGGQDSTTCLYWAKQRFDRVEAMGTPLVDMTVSVDASAYEHAGASILGNGDGWFIYSYTAATWIDQPWPELPEGLDIDGFFDTAAGQNHHAFCLTYDESREPWNWSEYEGLRALLESTVLPPPAP